MKSAVVYFSQTGNTRKIAGAIQKGITAVTQQCDLLNLKEAESVDLSRYSLLGIGCPVFFYKEPANVKAFMENLPQLKDKHGFVFATHGTVLGKTLTTMSWTLHRKGLVVIGEYHCYGDVFVPSIPYPYFTTGHPDQIDLDEAQSFGKEMVAISQRTNQGEIGLIRKPKVADWGRTPSLSPPREQMVLNNDKCRYPQCRLCVDNCPVDGIDLSADPIVFRKNCISCLFCEQVCPYGAIEADWEGRWRARLSIYRKYEKAAEKAERQGLLRRYFDVDIYNPDKLRFRVFPTRPRLAPYVRPLNASWHSGNQHRPCCDREMV